GTPTFGKGTVQAVRPLNHGQLKITQAKFYRISGASTQHKGVVPDIILPDTIDTSKVGEDALDHALEWDSIASAKFSKVGALSPLSQKLAESHITRITQHPEYVLLLEEIELLESQRGIEKVTINEQKRKTEDEAFDKARLDLLNKRRRLEQKPEFESLQAWRDSEDEKPIETDKAQEPDFIVEESAEVLLDFISLQQVSANALANAL
ncbi:carboxy terminal-processing peptidase, partial [Oleiphilus sp. HI0117]